MKIIEDDVGVETGNECDSTLYRIDIDDGSTVDVWWRDLHPPLNE